MLRQPSKHFHSGRDTKPMVWERYPFIVSARPPVPDATAGLHGSTPVESRSQMKWLGVAAPGSEAARRPAQSSPADVPPLPPSVLVPPVAALPSLPPSTFPPLLPVPASIDPPAASRVPRRAAHRAVATTANSTSKRQRMSPTWAEDVQPSRRSTNRALGVVFRKRFHANACRRPTCRRACRSDRSLASSTPR